MSKLAVASLFQKIGGYGKIETGQAELKREKRRVLSMRKSYQVMDENGECWTVVYAVCYMEGALRPYGIQGWMEQESAMVESAELLQRFLTREEAEAWIDLLIQEQVMPCTLMDVVG